MDGSLAGLRGLLFDKDGTLFSFQATWAGWAQGIVHDLAEGDATRATALAEAMRLDLDGPRFRPESPIIAGTEADAVATLMPHLPGWEVRDLFLFLARRSMEIEPVQAVPLAPLMARLGRAGLALGVATNDSESSARVHLERCGVAGAFDFVAGYDSGHGRKPEPGPCLAFAAEMGLAPAEIAMVGDSRHDLDAGRAAGMRTVAVLTGVALAEDLAPLADVVVPDIGHLPALLGLGPAAA